MFWIWIRNWNFSWSLLMLRYIYIFSNLVNEISTTILNSKRKANTPETARHISIWKILLVPFYLRVSQYRGRNYVRICWGGFLVSLLRQFMKTVFFLLKYLDMWDNIYFWPAFLGNWLHSTLFMEHNQGFSDCGHTHLQYFVVKVGIEKCAWKGVLKIDKMQLDYFS